MLTNELAQAIADCYKRGGKVLICGNGGLAATSEHFAAELMGKYGREVYIPCIALTCNSSLLTAISNDIGFFFVFEHQIKILAKPEDLVIGMTTSASDNIIAAINTGRCKSVIICGNSLDSRVNSANMVIRVTGVDDDVATIQEKIIKLLHAVAREAKEIISG